MNTTAREKGAVEIAVSSDSSPAEGEREVMNAEEAADFLRVPYQQFRRLASEIPRHAVSDRRYVYIRSELLEWLRAR